MKKLILFTLTTLLFSVSIMAKVDIAPECSVDEKNKLLVIHTIFTEKYKGKGKDGIYKYLYSFHCQATNKTCYGVRIHLHSDGKIRWQDTRTLKGLKLTYFSKDINILEVGDYKFLYHPETGKITGSHAPHSISISGQCPIK